MQKVNAPARTHSPASLEATVRLLLGRLCGDCASRNLLEVNLLDLVKWNVVDYVIVTRPLRRLQPVGCEHHEASVPLNALGRHHFLLHRSRVQAIIGGRERFTLLFIQQCGCVMDEVLILSEKFGNLPSHQSFFDQSPHWPPTPLVR